MKELTKYIRSLFSKFTKHAQHAAKDFKADDIHKMRVTFKKIEAVFNLLRFFCNENLNQEEITKAKRTFKKAGKVRELQLMIERVKSVETKSEAAKTIVINYLDNKGKKTEKKFQQYFNESGEKEIHEVGEKMIDVAKEISDNDLLPYFKNISENIVLVETKKERNEDELHQLRKRIKELNYNLVLLNDATRKKVEEIFPPGNYSSLEKLIGEWHDETIFLSGIGKAEIKLLADAADTEKQAGLKDFFEELHNESEKFLRQHLKRIDCSIDRKIRKNATRSIVL
jgi:CHAD domain-containing protein